MAERALTIAFRERAHGLLASMPVRFSLDPTEAERHAMRYEPLLTARERAYARGLAPVRRQSWVAGRVVLAAALERLGAERRALLVDARGAPRLPRGFVGSISHKRERVVALAAPAGRGEVGVDLEALWPQRPRIAKRVLRDAEQRAVMALEPGARWREIVVRFSLKEAFYKAIDRYLGRFLGFDACEVGALAGGRARMRAWLEPQDGAFEVEGAWWIEDGFVVTTCRVQPVKQA